MTDDELMAEVNSQWDHWAGHFGLQNWLVEFRKVKHTPAFFMEMHLDQDGNGGYQRVQFLVSPQPEEKIWGSISRNVLHEAIHVVYCYQDLFIRETLAGPSYAPYGRLIEGNADELTAVIWRLHEQTGCEL